MWLGIFHWDESTTGEWYSSSQWPLLPFHSGMLLHHNEWGDATAAGPGTSQARSQKIVWPWLWSFLIFIVPYCTLFVCFNRGFTFDSRWIWCSFLTLEGGFGFPPNDHCWHLTVACNCTTMNGRTRLLRDLLLPGTSQAHSQKNVWPWLWSF